MSGLMHAGNGPKLTIILKASYQPGESNASDQPWRNRDSGVKAVGGRRGG